MEEDRMMKKHGMVLIGGSAGSLDIVLRILPTLTSDLGLPIVIVLHRKNSNDNILVDLLSTRTDLVVKEVDEKEAMLPNVIYVAPADYHLLIERDLTFSLDVSEKVNYSRPSIDVTFESAADVFGSHTAGLLLSGANADGVEGLRKIKAAGGMIMVQDH